MGFRHAVICLLVAAPVAAQDFSGLPDPLVTDRPDFTESTSIVPPGAYMKIGRFIEKVSVTASLLPAPLK